MLQTLKKFFAFCGADNRRLFMASIWLGVVSAICSAMRIPAAAIVIQALLQKNVTVPTLWTSLGIIVISLIITIAINMKATMLQTRAGYRACANKRIEIAEHLRYLPMGGIVLAFKNYKVNPRNPSFISNLLSSKWVGFKNFEFLFKTDSAWVMIRNTLAYNIVFIVLGVIIPVAFAIMMNEITRKFFKKAYQTMMFFPYFLSWVVVSYFLNAFLDAQYGMIPAMQEAAGHARTSWYTTPGPWPFILTFANLWKNVGYSTVLYLAAITGIESDAVVEAVMAAGARQVYLIDEPIAAALGSGIDITLPDGRMIIDIGGGTTDIAVLSLGGKVKATSVRVAGNHYDEEILKHVRNKYSIAIGQRTAEELKKHVACCPQKTDFHESMEIKGRSLLTGLPVRVTVSTDDLYEPVMMLSEQIGTAAHQVLEKTPPELAGDIYRNGVMLTGGGAQLHGLTEYLSQELKVEVTVSPDPVNCVALGTAQSLSLGDKLETGFTDATPRIGRR